MKFQGCLWLSVRRGLASPPRVLGGGSWRDAGQGPEGTGARLAVEPAGWAARLGWSSLPSPGGGPPPGRATGHACRSAGHAVSLGPCRPLSSADLSQVEITRAYLAKQADEISLQQADVVLVLGGEDGKGRELRPGKVYRRWGKKLQSCQRTGILAIFRSFQEALAAGGVRVAGWCCVPADDGGSPEADGGGTATFLTSDSRGSQQQRPGKGGK